MTKRDWAREKAQRVSLRLDIHSGYFKQKDVIDLLRAERSRARRIVRAQIAQIRAEIRAIDDGHYEKGIDPVHEVNALFREIVACNDILARLQ